MPESRSLQWTEPRRHGQDEAILEGSGQWAVWSTGQPDSGPVGGTQLGRVCAQPFLTSDTACSGPASLVPAPVPRVVRPTGSRALLCVADKKATWPAREAQGRRAQCSCAMASGAAEAAGRCTEARSRHALSP